MDEKAAPAVPAPYDRYSAPTRRAQTTRSRSQRHANRKVGMNDPDVAVRLDGLQRIIEQLRPVPQRTVFYRATEVLSRFYKKEAGVDGNGNLRTASEITRLSSQMMSDDINILRRQGRIGWNDVTDMVSADYPPGFSSVRDLLHGLSRGYQQDYWAVATKRVAVTVESEQLWSALVPRLRDIPTPLFGLGGLPSLPLKRELSDWLAQSDETPVVLHVGDHDGMGWEIQRTLDAGLREHHVHADIRRILMYEQQGIDLGLPVRMLATGADKKQDLAWGFGAGDRVYEAEAMDPGDIADLIRTEVQRVLDPAVMSKVKSKQDAARQRLADLASREPAV